MIFFIWVVWNPGKKKHSIWWTLRISIVEIFDFWMQYDKILIWQELMMEKSPTNHRSYLISVPSSWHFIHAGQIFPLRHSRLVLYCIKKALYRVGCAFIPSEVDEAHGKIYEIILRHSAPQVMVLLMLIHPTEICKATCAWLISWMFGEIQRSG